MSAPALTAWLSLPPLVREQVLSLLRREALQACTAAATLREEAGDEDERPANWEAQARGLRALAALGEEVAR